MTAEWLTYQSFQRNQEVLKAINILSTHLKMALNGILDEERARAANQSVQKLQEFFAELEAATEQADLAESSPMLGVNPRLQELAYSYLAARQGRRFRSCLFTGSIDDIKPLLNSETRHDWETLVECLAEFRVLVEEHLSDDLGEILGEF